MKKIIAFTLVLALALVSLTACGGGKKVSSEDAAAMAGDWQLVLYDIYGVKMLTEDTGVNMSVAFGEDGKATFDIDGETEEHKWEKDGNLVTVWVDEGAGVSKGRTADLEGDFFTLYWKYNDEPVKMVFAKAGTDAVNPENYIKEGDITSTALKNADENTIGEILDKLSPEALEAFDLTDTYNEYKGIQEQGQGE